jgi:hypothetical protein
MWQGSEVFTYPHFGYELRAFHPRNDAKGDVDYQRHLEGRLRAVRTWNLGDYCPLRTATHGAEQSVDRPDSWWLRSNGRPALDQLGCLPAPQ